MFYHKIFYVEVNRDIVCYFSADRDIYMWLQQTPFQRLSFFDIYILLEDKIFKYL
jgi:hypothetical protein